MGKKGRESERERETHLINCSNRSYIELEVSFETERTWRIVVDVSH